MANYWILTRRNLLVFSLLPLLLGALVCVYGWRSHLETSAFVENLKETEARIQRVVPGDDGSQVDVEYLDPDGVKYTQRFQMSTDEAVRLRAIGKVSLVYDQRDPRKSEIGHVVSANNEKMVDILVLVAGLLILLGGLAYAVTKASQISAIGKLFRTGQIVQTEVRDSAMAPGRNVGRFTYAFRGPNGRWFEGKSPELTKTELDHWPVGRTVIAAYDPKDPRRSEVDVFGVLAKVRDLQQPA